VKWRLVIRPRAETDLREARDWYESQRADLGGEIEAAIQALVRDQQRQAVHSRGCRRVLPRRLNLKRLRTPALSCPRVAC
jgi:plasmid stabilization system protein ParE